MFLREARRFAAVFTAIAALVLALRLDSFHSHRAETAPRDNCAICLHASAPLTAPDVPAPIEPPAPIAERIVELQERVRELPFLSVEESRGPPAPALAA